jgi:hypothetical protein
VILATDYVMPAIVDPTIQTIIELDNHGATAEHLERGCVDLARITSTRERRPLDESSSAVRGRDQNIEPLRRIA